MNENFKEFIINFEENIQYKKLFSSSRFSNFEELSTN